MSSSKQNGPISTESPDYLSFSYDYDKMNNCHKKLKDLVNNQVTKKSKRFKIWPEQQGLDIHMLYFEVLGMCLNI